MGINMTFEFWKQYDEGTYFFDFRSDLFSIWSFTDCGAFFLYWHSSGKYIHRIMKHEYTPWWVIQPYTYDKFQKIHKKEKNK
jgi:hypothetical protein